MSLSEEDLKTIRRALEQLHFYELLSPDELTALLGGFEKTPIKNGEVLITEGKTGEIFYILGEGEVGVYLKGALVDRKVATLGPDSYFGEMSLISEDPRSANVVCEKDGVAFTLLRETFSKAIMRNPRIAEMIRHTASKRRADRKAIEYSEWMAHKIR